jgi:dipeptidyl aminopeptidase/acylaminoacyl peptidase
MCTRTPSARLIAIAVFAAAPAFAQGTAADYARSDGLRRRLEGTVAGTPQNAAWIGRTNSFWYRRSTTGTGTEIVVVDAATKTKRTPVDEKQLTQALASATRRPGPDPTFPLGTLTFTGIDTIEITVDSVRWRCSVGASYACTQRDRQQPNPGLRQGGGLFGTLGTPDERPKVSPDGKWEAVVQNFNIQVRPADRARRSEAVMLSGEGTELDAYSQQSIVWSPDSRFIAAYRVKPGFRREIYYIMSSPEDQLQPKKETMLYNKPGDVLDVEQPVLFDVAARKQTIVDRALFPDAYDQTGLAWRKDNRAFSFEYNQRGHQAFRVIEVDAATGRARAQINEEMPTFFEYSAKRYRLDIADGKEVVWMSERDGWNHLYLYDGVTGRVKNQITKGQWLVRGVERVDTIARQIYFTASGMYAGKDPYFVHFYRINFDGTGLVTYTEADATHSISLSSDMAYFVDTYSRVDLPQVSQLRRTSDRSLVMELEKADASKLLATGWKPPEVFVSKARDGKTDIWGVIIRPTNFDPARKYPVIENIYAGPQGSFVPKTFSTQLGMQSIAELGFIVVQIDGMGTSNRSKAFHDVAYMNLGDAGFPDRILWHKAVAARYAYYDISRVGIYGTSAGGQNSMGALLFHPEFYKVAVSAAGCHDNRMDKIWWNEQWMGKLGPHYAASSNMEHAGKLEGKLMLVVGEMDKNVDPASTMQVVNALIKANKTFDLLVLPGAGHTSGGPYGERKRNDFFVHHLMGVEPPDRNTKVSASVSSTNPQ